MKSSAIVNPNIAFIKYWGKSLDYHPFLNIPLNDTISMTNYGLSSDVHLETHTTIEFSEDYNEDIAILGDAILRDLDLMHISTVVHSLMELADVDYKFKMVSKNDFPTQAGIASSAAGFAALAISTADALDLDISDKKLSTYARLGSGSAARSIYGGFAYWNQGRSHQSSYAVQICEPDDFDIGAVLAIVSDAKKKVPSYSGHDLAHTSPFNESRVYASHDQVKQIQNAIWDDDFTTVGKIAEENCNLMHVVAMTSKPQLFYWIPETYRIIESLREWRADGFEAYYTIDAGPNIHCLSRPEDRDELQSRLESLNITKQLIPIAPSKGPRFTEKHLF